MSQASRLKEIISNNNLTIKGFSDVIGIHETTLNKIENRTGQLSSNMRDKIKLYFPEFDMDYILTGKGPINSSAHENETNYRQLKTIDEDPNGKDIPFVDGEFFATISPAMQDVITLKKDTFVRIPMFSRGEFAIQVTGNSMKGYINNGDWIIIRKLERLDKIIYGEVYVVVTKYDNHRTIKFIKEDQEDDSILWLVPYNVEQFEPQTIEKEDVLEIYLVIGSFKKIGN